LEKNILVSYFNNFKKSRIAMKFDFVEFKNEPTKKRKRKQNYTLVEDFQNNCNIKKNQKGNRKFITSENKYLIQIKKNINNKGYELIKNDSEISFDDLLEFEVSYKENDEDNEITNEEKGSKDLVNKEENKLEDFEKLINSFSKTEFQNLNKETFINIFKGFLNDQIIPTDIETMNKSIKQFKEKIEKTNQKLSIIKTSYEELFNKYEYENISVILTDEENNILYVNRFFYERTISYFGKSIIDMVLVDIKSLIMSNFFLKRTFEFLFSKGNMDEFTFDFVINENGIVHPLRFISKRIFHYDSKEKFINLIKILNKNYDL
jgi:hypothetical protein